MAPPKAALAQSESKARFFERLGLDEENENHRRLYAMMKVRLLFTAAVHLCLLISLFSKEEAVEGRRRMTASPESLAPQFRDDPKVEPPYSNAQISESAIHQEIIRIYQNARRETKEIYDLGRDIERVEEENWIIRWMLWHVFRYRDNRNRNRRAASPHDGSDPGSSRSPGPTTSAPTTCTTPRWVLDR